jgi:hypothetical protein
MSVSDFWKSKLPDRRVIAPRVFGNATKPHGTGTKHGLNDQHGPQMVSMRQGGASVKEIASHFGVAQTTCYEIMRRTQSKVKVAK